MKLDLVMQLEGELRKLRNQLANSESQNRILGAYVIEMKRRRLKRRLLRDAARHRKAYAEAPYIRPPRQNGLHIKLMAPAVAKKLHEKLCS